MTFTDEEGIAELNSALKNVEFLKSNGAAQKLLDEGYMLIVAYASDLQTGQSFNVGIQNIGMLASLTLNERKFLDLQCPSIPKALESQGFTDITAEIYDLTMCGESHPAIVVSSLIQGYPFYEIMLVSIKSSYASFYTFAGFDLESLLNMVSAIERIQ
ncbi:MAG: hypothetical protein K6G60_05825 [Lachnospiraceae bacterium]|nr:hypothetical protein [Lachnospiraceae bacterium]